MQCLYPDVIASQGLYKYLAMWPTCLTLALSISYSLPWEPLVRHEGRVGYVGDMQAWQ